MNDEELLVTKRGVLQLVGAMVITASFAARRPLFAPAADEDTRSMAAVEDEPFLIDHATGARLESFLRSRGIKPAHLARESGYSRQFLLRLRLGRVAPTSRCVVHVVRACQRLAGEPVQAGDLFELSTAGLHAVERMQRRLIE